MGLKKCPKCGKRRLWFVEFTEKWICYNCNYKKRGLFDKVPKA